MKQLATILLMLCFATSNAFAVTYYISNAGNDANNGTSTTTPWRTLTKLSAELGGTSGTWGTISTGDKVYFRRGDVFRGSIAFSAYNNDGITFDAYGSGVLPIIKGSDIVPTWTVHSGNIWKATMSKRVYFLYVNTALKTLARAPNTGTWNLSTATGTSLTSDDNNHTALSASNNNFLCNPYGTKVAEYLWTNAQIFTLAQWRTATGLDAASVGSYYTWTSPNDNSFLVVNNTAAAKTYTYSNCKNLNNQNVASLTLQPFTSQVLVNLTVLPVELLHFTGKNTEGGNLLTWTTANETNNKGFYVETRFIASNPANSAQSTTDEWKILDFIAAKKNAPKDAIYRVSTYYFIDNQPLTTSYYRLRQMDNDGKETFSKVISVATKGKGKLKVYPSVTTDILTIETSETADYQVFNLLGQQVLTGKTPPSGLGGLTYRLCHKGHTS